MRGKDAAAGDGLGSVGITPAHAGKSVAPPSRTLPVGDHPRTCGEKTSLFIGRRIDKGITPAHAGKRQSFFPFCQYLRDHPRTCGEKALGIDQGM